MLDEQQMQTAAAHMARHYTKPDGTPAGDAKGLRETTAWAEESEKVTQTFAEAGLAVTDASVAAEVFKRLLRDTRTIETLDCHIVLPQSHTLRKEGKEWVKEECLTIIDENGRLHDLVGKQLPADVEPGTPATLSGGEMSVSLTFGSWGKDDKPGRANDPPAEFINVHGDVTVELNTHDKPFPMGGPNIDGALERAKQPDKKTNVVWGNIGPNERDGLSGDIPFIAQCFVERAFLNEWDSGTYVSTVCKTPGEAEVEVLHPIESLHDQFPGIASADRDSIGRFFEDNPRFLAIGNCDITRTYTLSKMSEDERRQHLARLQELTAKGLLVDRVDKVTGKVTGKRLDLSNNTRIKVTVDGKEREVPAPFVTVGARKYVNISLYSKQDGTQDAKFTALQEHEGGRPRIKCHEERGTWPSGEEFHHGQGFRCVWLGGGGIKAPSAADADRVMTLFG